MAFIVYERSWVPGDRLDAEDLDADFSNVTDQVNGNLDDSNLSASAGIEGSKLASAPNGVGTPQINDLAVTGAKLADAPNGITTGKINDLQVTTAKLAVGASIPGLVTAAASANLSGITAETALCTLPSITTRGGKVLIAGAVGLVAVLLGGVQAVVALRVYRDAVLVYRVDYKVLVDTSGQISIPTPVIFDMPAAGSYVYKLTGEASTNSLATSANPGSLYAVEFA